MKNLRNDFPLLQAHKDLVYFDSAGTTQKPQQVIDALVRFYTYENAPVKRGMYQLAEHATALYEQARCKVAQCINAQPEEIIFTSGATESINFIAATWGEHHISSHDDIVLTQLEHHANLLPWQRLAARKGACLRYVPINDDGTLDLRNLDAIITNKTKLVSFLDVSNALGTHVEVAALVARARQVGARVLIDACQSVPHQPLDVKKYDADFLVFSGHKMLGPTGIGVLYIKKELQQEVPPYQLGGGMVMEVTYEKARFKEVPGCYEAGTPPIAQAIGLGAALDYMKAHVDFEKLRAHEAALCARAIEGLQALKNIRIVGPIDQLKQYGHLISFIHTKYHVHDVGAYLDKHGICVRTGHYCAQPLAKRLGIDGSIRLSFYLYNTLDEIEKFLKVMAKLS